MKNTSERCKMGINLKHYKIMKKLFFFIFLCCTNAICAQTFQSEDLWYSVYSTSAKTVQVKQHDDHKTLTSVTIPSTVEYNGTTYTVVRIGTCAFQDCSSLTSVTIPNSVTSILSDAFHSCSSLTSVTIPNSITKIDNYTFRYCSSLTSITIPNSVTSIGWSAFAYCSSLTSVTLPATITSMDTYTFSNCNMLRTIDVIATDWSDILMGAINKLLSNGSLNADVVRRVIIDGVEQKGHIVIPSAITSISAYALSGCKEITSIEVPTSVTSIGEQAFTEVAYLYMNATTPPTLANSNVINSTAFIVLPDAATLAIYQAAPVWKDLADRMITPDALKVREVSITAENTMSALHRVLGEANLLNTIKLKVHGTINSYDIMLIRNKMLNLRELDLSDAEVKACSYQYYTGYCTHDNKLEGYAFSELNLRVVHLPKNLTEITNCFNACPYLDTVYCQAGIQKIGKETFYNSQSLRYVEVKEGVKEIGEKAFYQTTRLETLNLPSSLETIGSYAFQYSGVKSITIPANVTTINNGAFKNGSLEYLAFAPNGKLSSIPDYLFESQKYLKNIDWENSSITNIGKYAMQYCSSLKLGNFPKGLKSIGNYAFNDCSSIDSIVLPKRLESIGQYAFQNCTNTQVIKISSSVKQIGNYAFSGCSNVKRVYTYTVEPTSIQQQTFSCYKTADLYVPATSYYNYYYNTQWSQFLKLIEVEEEYSYFYLYGDYYLGGTYGVIKGNPDVDLFAGSGLIIVGDDKIGVSNIHYYADASQKCASLITDNNLNIDTLFVHFPQTKGKWHYTTFPFNINREDIQCGSEFVVRYYDGQIRAENTKGGWQNVPVGKQMLNGQGYIFQAAAKDTLTLAFAKPKLPNKDITIPLYTYPAESIWDANWNMVGNPYLSYYDLDSIKGFTYPIVAWNGTGYDTYRPGDDSYHFKPLESFFIQNVDLTQITLPINGRETYTQANSKRSSAPARRNMAAEAQAKNRWLVDITISDSAYTDRTRVVFNEEASVEYDLGVDANKTIVTTAPVQLYTIGKSNEQYSINERPATTNGEVINLGYYAAHAGTFTLSVSRMDTTFMLYDNVEDQYVDLSQGDYTFDSEAGFNDTRFVMYAVETEEEQPTSIETLDKQNMSKVNVYSVTGQVVAENVDLQTTQLPAGVYMIKKNNEIYKIILQ